MAISATGDIILLSYPPSPPPPPLSLSPPAPGWPMMATLCWSWLCWLRPRLLRPLLLLLLLVADLSWLPYAGLGYHQCWTRLLQSVEAAEVEGDCEGHIVFIVYNSFIVYVCTPPPPLYICIVWHNWVKQKKKEISFVSSLKCVCISVIVMSVYVCIPTLPPPFVEFLCIYPTLYFVVPVQVCCLVNLVWIQCLIKQSCINQWRERFTFKVLPPPPLTLPPPPTPTQLRSKVWLIIYFFITSMEVPPRCVLGLCNMLISHCVV